MDNNPKGLFDLVPPFQTKCCSWFLARPRDLSLVPPVYTRWRTVYVPTCVLCGEPFRWYSRRILVKPGSLVLHENEPKKHFEGGSGKSCWYQPGDHSISPGDHRHKQDEEWVRGLLDVRALLAYWTTSWAGREGGRRRGGCYTPRRSTACSSAHYYTSNEPKDVQSMFLLRETQAKVWWRPAQMQVWKRSCVDVIKTTTTAVSTAVGIRETASVVCTGVRVYPNAIWLTRPGLITRRLPRQRKKVGARGSARARAGEHVHDFKLALTKALGHWRMNIDECLCFRNFTSSWCACRPHKSSLCLLAHACCRSKHTLRKLEMWRKSNHR